jgi:hypothetical protein
MFAVMIDPMEAKEAATLRPTARWVVGKILG